MNLKTFVAFVTMIGLFSVSSVMLLSSHSHDPRDFPEMDTDDLQQAQILAYQANDELLEADMEALLTNGLIVGQTNYDTIVEGMNLNPRHDTSK